jgi:hypothetical protein
MDVSRTYSVCLQWAPPSPYEHIFTIWLIQQHMRLYCICNKCTARGFIVVVWHYTQNSLVVGNMLHSPEEALNELAKGRVHVCWGHIYEALATLRRHKSFVKQPVNKTNNRFAWLQSCDGFVMALQDRSIMLLRVIIVNSVSLSRPFQWSAKALNWQKFM